MAAPQINAGPVALEAASRNEADLLALLPPEPSAKSRPQRAVVMSALARGADIGGAAGHVRYGPNCGLMRCNEEHHHSITSSARPSSVEGASTPSDLAVFILIANSNLIGCSTGRSRVGTLTCAASLTTQPVKANWLVQAVVSISLENLKTLLLEARNGSRQIYCVH